MRIGGDENERHAQCTMKRTQLPCFACDALFSYQLCSFLGKIFGFSGNSLSFINIVLNVTVSSERCSGIERDVLSLIQDSVRLDGEKNFSTQIKNNHVIKLQLLKDRGQYNQANSKSF